MTDATMQITNCDETCKWRKENLCAFPRKLIFAENLCIIRLASELSHQEFGLLVRDLLLTGKGKAN